VAAPALYAAVLWICRPRALWRTNVAARRFAIGRYAISVDAATRTVVVWVESRKLGQYDARELSVHWPDGQGDAGAAPVAVTAAEFGTAEAVAPVGIGSAPASAVPRTAAHSGWLHRRPKVELHWDSPAAAGHNHQTVFRAALATEGDRVAARALDTSLRQA
jgi:hypothetical protein